MEKKGQPAGWLMLVLSMGFILASGVIYFLIYLMIPQFKEIFAGFGAELPAQTAFVVSTYKYYGFLTLFGLVPCVQLYMNRKVFNGNEKRLFAVIVISFVLSVLVFTFAVYSMYLPIFTMGDAISTAN